MRDNIEKARTSYSQEDDDVDAAHDLAARITKLRALLLDNGASDVDKNDISTTARQLLSDTQSADEGASDTSRRSRKDLSRSVSHAASTDRTAEPTKEKALGAKSNVHEGHRRRLRESASKDKGLESFSDVQILELLLGFGVLRRDTNPTAHALLNKFGSLFNVFRATPEQLLSVDGVTAAAAKLIVELSKICKWDDKCELCVKPDDNDTTDFLGAASSVMAEDEVLAFYLDKQYKLLAAESLPVGEGRLARAVVAASCKHETNYVLFVKRSDYFPEPQDVVVDIRAAMRALKHIGMETVDCLVFNEFGYYTLTDSVRKDEPDYIFISYKHYTVSPLLVEILANTENNENE